MLSVKDATRTPVSSKEEDLRYHISLMEYWIGCHQKEKLDSYRSFEKFLHHKREAEAIQSSLEDAC